MATTGALSPTVSANQGDIWGNPDYIFADDNNFATETGGFTEWLGGQIFGFDIPEDAVIDSIKVDGRGYGDSEEKDGRVIYVAWSPAVPDFEAHDQQLVDLDEGSEGDFTYTWTSDLPDAEYVNTEDFGILIARGDDYYSDYIYIDHVTLTITYHVNITQTPAKAETTPTASVGTIQITNIVPPIASTIPTAKCAITNKALLPKVTTWYTETNDPNGYGYESPDPDVATEGLVTWNPKFTAEPDIGGVKYYKIQVGTGSSGSAAYDMWEYYGTFTNTLAAGEREKITYGGAVLQSDVTYYYEITYKHINGSSYGSSAGKKTFKGVIPIQQWSTDWHRRKLLRFEGSHPAYEAGQQTTIEFATGYGETISENAWINDAIVGIPRQIVRHKGYVYVSYIYFNPDDASTYQQGYISKRDLDGVWTHYKFFDGENSNDIHNYICIEVGQDEKLYACRSGHHTQSQLRASTVAHTDEDGIDITSWGAWDTTNAALTYTTYPRISKSESGHLYLFVRGGVEVSGTKWLMYITNKWNGSSYDGWGTTPRFIVHYNDPYYTDSTASVYSGYPEIRTVDGQERCYISINFWDDYGNKNEGRAISLIWSAIELDNTNSLEDEFYSWNEYYDNEAGYREVARTSTTSDNTYLLKYGANDSGVAPTKLYTVNNPTPSTGDFVGPCALNNQGSIIVNNDGIPFVGYSLFPDRTERYAECQSILSKWDLTEKKWLHQDLSGDSLFIADASGTDGNGYTVTIAAGTVSGKKFTLFNGDATTETFDNVETPDILFRAINHGYSGINSGNACSFISLKFVGSQLPDNCSATNLADGSATGPVYAYKIFESTDAGFKPWNYRHGYKFVIDNTTLHGFALYKPSGKEQFGGELVQMIGTSASGDDLPTWSYKILTANSGNGIGMMDVVSTVESGAPIELVYCRYNTINYVKAGVFPSVLPNGNDIRIVEYYNNGSSVSTTELKRLPVNAFQQEDTTLVFKLNTAISANKVAPTSRVLMLEYNNSGASDPEHDPDDIHNLYESFEDYTVDSDLDGQDSWAMVTGEATIFDTWQISYYLKAATNKVAAGDKYLAIAGEYEYDFEENLSNKLVKIRIWDEDGYGNFYLELFDSAENYFRLGISDADVEQAQVVCSAPIIESGTVTARQDITERDVSGTPTELIGDVITAGANSYIYLAQDVDPGEPSVINCFVIITEAGNDYMNVFPISAYDWATDKLTLSTSTTDTIAIGTGYTVILPSGNKRIYDSAGDWNDGDYDDGSYRIKFTSGQQSGNVFVVDEARDSVNKWIETTTAMDPMPIEGDTYVIYQVDETWQYDYDIEAVENYYHEYIILMTDTNGCYAWCDGLPVWDTANVVKQFNKLKIFGGVGILMDYLEVDTVPSTWTTAVLPTGTLIGEAITNETILAPTIASTIATASAGTHKLGWVKYPATASVTPGASIGGQLIVSPECFAIIID